jgi:hypothetical protein
MTFYTKLRDCLIAAAFLFTPMLFAVPDHKPAYIAFDVPDSVATYPLSINGSMTVTGYYVGKSGGPHGFVRDEEGRITRFDVSGSTSTMPVSINQAGEIAGTYITGSTSPIPGIPQGFVRSAEGTMTLFGDMIAPYGVSNRGGFQGNPVQVNVDGEVVGNFPYPDAAPSVFTRSRSGALQAFSLSFGASYPTIATGLNAGGAVIGYSSSESLVDAQGFLWTGQGPVPTPGSSVTTSISVSGSTGTFPTSINADGSIVGCYSIDANAGKQFAPLALTYHDFLREPDGTITTLSIPGTIPACLANENREFGITIVSPATTVINHEGTIVGTYINTAKLPAGFIRKTDGRLTTFTHSSGSMTMPTAVNDQDVITGYFAEGIEIRGFLLLPDDCAR